MNRIKDLRSNDADVDGIRPDALVRVTIVQWLASEAMAMIQETPASKVVKELRYPAQDGWGFRSLAASPQLFPRRHTSEFREIA